MLLIVAVAAGIALLAGLLVFQGTAASAAGFIPVSMQSLQRADNSAEQREAFVAPIEIELIEDTLRDSEPELPASEVEQRVQEVLIELETPVPTVTPLDPTSSAAAQETIADTPTATLTPTAGPSSTAGPSPTETDLPTAGPSPTQADTATAGPSPTADASLTALAQSSPIPSQSATPIVTSSPTGTQTPTPTATLTASPTETYTPTPSPTYTPSHTPTYTPTPTSTPGCNITIGNFQWETANKWVKLDVTNNMGSTIRLTENDFTWPSIVNGDLKEMLLDDDQIYDTQASPTHVNVPADQPWKSGTESFRDISASDTDVLEFRFDQGAKNNGYIVDLTFDNGCTQSFSN